MLESDRLTRWDRIFDRLLPDRRLLALGRLLDFLPRLKFTWGRAYLTRGRL